MSNTPYNRAVRDCFANPDHAGELEGGIKAYFEDQGMRIRLSATLSDGTLSKLRFLAWGCPHVVAAAETFCRQYEGHLAAELEQFESGPIMQDLAVPVEKTGRILVLEDTVRSLGQAIQDQLSTKQD